MIKPLPDPATATYGLGSSSFQKHLKLELGNQQTVGNKKTLPTRYFYITITPLLSVRRNARSTAIAPYRVVRRLCIII
ncbi:MAG: hypothetical protein NTX45_25395 [Proteobacteria bacterium]|nr:hypothetical protein [Pseudomonadota bacterium]